MKYLSSPEDGEDGLAAMEATLNQAEVGRLALSQDGQPYIVPLNFLYQDGQIAFHCALTGKKLDIIAQNPRCCLEVDEFQGEVSYHYDALCHLDYDSVLAVGTARIEDEPAAKLRFFAGLHAKYKEIYRKPVAEGGLTFDTSYPRFDTTCCVVIDVDELTGRRERTVDGERQKTTWRHRF